MSENHFASFAVCNPIEGSVLRAPSLKDIMLGESREMGDLMSRCKAIDGSQEVVATSSSKAEWIEEACKYWLE